MNKRVAHIAFFFVENLGAAVWVGALVSFGFAVAGTVFQQAPSINVAGNLNAAILGKLNRLEFVAAACMGLGTLYFLLQTAERTRLRLCKAGIWLVMVGALVIYATMIADRLEHLRTVEIQDFDNFDMAKQAFRDEFARLHHWYTWLVKANLFLGLGFLFLSACERREAQD
jgi:predicted membrane channel-forming protein YqfA (hemolysin III family)